MNIAGQPQDHQSPGGNPPHAPDTDSKTGQFDRMTVHHPPRGKFVKLSHSFIQRWSRVLTPLEFLVFCIIEMWADFSEWKYVDRETVGEWPFQPLTERHANPTYGHTLGYHGIADIVQMTGISRSPIERCLRQLVHYGLLRHSDPDPTNRMAAGVKSDWIVDQNVEPPSEYIAMTRKGLREHARECRRADKTSSKTLTPTSQETWVPRPGRRTPLRPRRRGSYVPGDVPNSVESVEPLVGTPPASSSSVEAADEPTMTMPDPDEPGRPPEPVRPIRQQTPERQTIQDEGLVTLGSVGNLVLEDALVLRLWHDARAIAPDITSQELHAAMSCKVGLASMPSVRNGPMYLVTCVTKALAGGWLLRYRELMEKHRANLESVRQQSAQDRQAWELYERGDGLSPWTGKTKSEDLARAAAYVAKNSR